jgi:hypothetical protein
MLLNRTSAVMLLTGYWLLGPKWHSPIGSMPFHRAQKIPDFQGPTPSTCPRNECCPHQKHSAQGCINHRCINSYYEPLYSFPINSPFPSVTKIVTLTKFFCYYAFLDKKWKSPFELCSVISDECQGYLTLLRECMFNW